VVFPPFSYQTSDQLDVITELQQQQLFVNVYRSRVIGDRDNGHGCQRHDTADRQPQASPSFQRQQLMYTVIAARTVAAAADFIVIVVTDKR